MSRNPVKQRKSGTKSFPLQSDYLHSLGFFAMDTELLSCLGMRAAKSFKFFNGPIECVLKNYRISAKRNVEKVVVAAPVVEKVKSAANSEPINPWTMGRGDDQFAMGKETESEIVFITALILAR